MKHSDQTYPKAYLYHRIVKAKLFIDNNFHEPIDLDLIADEAFFSKYHFIRLFRSIYNSTPHQYLIRVRIGKAKLLLQKDISVGDTCHSVGFDSITSFAALFKSVTRKTPAQYRQQYQERQEKIREQPLGFIPNCFAEQKGWKENSNIQ